MIFLVPVALFSYIFINCKWDNLFKGNEVMHAKKLFWIHGVRMLIQKWKFLNIFQSWACDTLFTLRQRDNAWRLHWHDHVSESSWSFGTKFIGKMGQLKKENRPWQDSNLQSPDPKSGALSIRPPTLSKKRKVYYCRARGRVRRDWCCGLPGKVGVAAGR